MRASANTSLANEAFFTQNASEDFVSKTKIFLNKAEDEAPYRLLCNEYPRAKG